MRAHEDEMSEPEDHPRLMLAKTIADFIEIYPDPYDDRRNALEWADICQAHRDRYEANKSSGMSFMDSSRDAYVHSILTLIEETGL